MSFFVVLLFAGLLPLSCFLTARFFGNANLKPFVSFGAGLLLSLCFLEFLPHSFEGDSHNGHSLVPLLILGGVLAQALADMYLLPRLSFLDRLLGTSKCQPTGGHSHTLSAGTVCSVFACLCLCSFFDGIRLLTAFEIGGQTGIAVGIALFFHLLSEGVALVVLAKAGGVKTKALFVLALCLPVALIAGALPAQLFLTAFPLHLLSAFASGILIYVCFVHLMPFSLKQKSKLWFFLGMALFALPHFFISLFQAHH